MAALQKTPITFQSRSPPSTQIITGPTANLSFSGCLKLQKLTIKLPSTRGGVVRAKMSDSSAAAGSYASALADVAKSNGTLDQTSADLEKVDKLFVDEEVFNFFISPVIDEEKKRKLIDEVASSSSLQPHVTNFLYLLIDRKRFELIKDIVKEFEKVYNKLTETELAVVTSVVTLESEHLAQIAKGIQRLTGAKNVRIKTAIDPSLVAGFTIRYGNAGSRFIDMSVRKQLDELADQLDIGDIQLAL